MYLFIIKQLEYVEKLTWCSEELGSSTAILPWFTGFYRKLTGFSSVSWDTPVAVQGFTLKQSTAKKIHSVIVFLSLWP